LADLKLSPEQIQTLKRHGEDFKDWSSTEKGIKDIQDHIDHGRYFKEKLSSENLIKMTEEEFAEIWKKSWTSKLWGNKDRFIKNKFIDPNGFETIRLELNLLLFGPDDFVKRYDKYRNNVSGFGVAIISELLNMIFPDKFCLWNDKAKIVLQFLGLDALPDTGQEYLQCVNYLKLIKNELSEFGVKDFINLDVFFRHIFVAKKIDNDSEKPDLELELLKSNIQKLVTMYESIKPIIHYNIPYALRFYNIKREEIRNIDWKRHLISLFAPTGGWFALLFFKRRVKKMFKTILSTCDLYLLLQEQNWKETRDSLKDIKDTVLSKREELTKRKASHRAEQTTIAFQILGVIIAIASISWITNVVPGLSSIKLLNSEILEKAFKMVPIVFILIWVATWMLPKVIWYRRVVKFSNLKQREKEVYKSLIEILKSVEDKEINRITIKDFMRSFYGLRRNR
jgi:hypothetical protein